MRSNEYLMADPACLTLADAYSGQPGMAITATGLVAAWGRQSQRVGRELVDADERPTVDTLETQYFGMAGQYRPTPGDATA